MKALSILLLASVGAFGQTVCPDGQLVGCAKGSRILASQLAPKQAIAWGDTFESMFCTSGQHGEWQKQADGTSREVCADPPKPLKCGKYERVEHKMAEMTCLYPAGHPERCPAPRYIDSCAPIMHEVRESEWQEAQERLNKLEKERQELMERLKRLEDPPCPSLLDRNTQKSCPL